MGGDFSFFPTFQLRYHGGPTTWTFDGGQTYVTFAEKTAYTYYYGGNWISLDCDNTFFSQGYAHFKSCLAEDWMIIVLPTNVWSDVNVVPKYMGYATGAVRSVKNTGYPGCTDVNSIYVQNCVAGRMYGQTDCAVDVSLASGSQLWHSCDSTPGHSGGPLFYTSGSANYNTGNDSSP
jgi:hypothetical protein